MTDSSPKKLLPHNQNLLRLFVVDISLIISEFLSDSLGLNRIERTRLPVKSGAI
jgi:hypothetical protein